MCEVRRKIRLRVTVWHHGALPTLCSPAFDFNVGVAIHVSRSYTLTSAILKVDVACDVTLALMSTPNILTTELPDLLYNQCIDNTCGFAFFFCLFFFIYLAGLIRIDYVK